MIVYLECSSKSCYPCKSKEVLKSTEKVKFHVHIKN